jgi:hypothetical protein
MESSKELFRKKISDAFTSLPNMNTKTMLDSARYQGMVEEFDELDEKWSEKYKKSINCNNPKGFSQKAHCQGRKKKKETKEATSSGAGVGSFEGPLGFDPDSDFVKKSFEETPELKKVEATEATGSGSVGAYSTPAFLAKSTNKKDWRGKSKTQIPGGTFVSVKKKCKKFPYCNQGDINALNIFKEEPVREAIKSVSEKLNISENVIKAILDYEYEKLSKERYLY